MKRFLASSVLVLILAGIVMMLSSVPIQSQNVYLPQPGAIRTFQGDSISLALTGCGGATNGVNVAYRFLPIGSTRPQDFLQVVGSPTGACPGGQNFVDVQIPLADGWLYGVGAINNAPGQDESQMWIQIYLSRNAPVFNNNAGAIADGLALVSCAPGLFQQCNWTLGVVTGAQQFDTSLLGQNLGANFNYPISQPVAGANFTMPMPDQTNQMYNIQNVRFTLVTSAVVGSRFVCLNLVAPGGAIFMSSCSSSAQPASSTVTYNFAIGTGPSPVITLAPGAANPDINGSLPSLVQIHDNSLINSNVIGIQAADQIASNGIIRLQYANYKD